jgi:D-alanyl-lipoteichoic acid acyltransferase DltB (MBOAT superfamily)
MLFNSLEFLIFLPVVLVVYYVLNRRSQNVWLLLCSYFFYGWWDWRFTSLLMISTVLDFNCARQMHRRPRMSRFFLVVSLCGNLGILCTFKYLNFFIDSVIPIFNLFHFNPDVPTLKVILPIGISFYTFQTLSYTIDVYRGKLKPTNNILDFALYVSIFPQLVAGPIERATNLLPQLERKRTVDGQMLASGLFLILLGYTKKVGIADAIAPFVDEIFDRPNQSSIRLLSALYLFSIQIYCDFSGYSDIARGISKLFGIDIMINFNQPYFSRNITEFWRRWHISLSSWLRDYLYIPLGGNRHGKAKTYRNIMITMVLAGLWHGANWTFVLWGALHGLYLVIHRFVFGRYRSESAPHFQFSPTNTRHILKIFFTFQLVALTWVFFRSADLPQAFAYLKGIVMWHGPLIDFGALFRVGFVGTLIVFIDWAQYKRNNHVAMLEWHWTKRGALYVLFLFIILLGKTYESIPFIYFQF